MGCNSVNWVNVSQVEFGATFVVFSGLMTPDVMY
jgi:hypothetical protein